MAQSPKKSPQSALGSKLDGLVAAVVVAFGPRSATRSAEKSVRKICGSDAAVLTVEALPSAEGSGGKAGLETAVSTLPHGPVLVIHDDVAIDAHSVGRLLEAHLRGATVAVPATNDRGTGHFHGSLPPAVSAKPTLRAIGRETSYGVRPIATARASCLIADSSTLRELVKLRVHDPFMMLNDQGLGVVAVDGAIAAHDGSCGDRVRASHSPTDAAVLVASMIVKNEAEMLGECLDSLVGLVDRVEVVDTGSTDATVAIAERHGANVSYFEWCDDFSAARNFGAGKCRDSMFTLWIDADERVSAAEPSLVRDVLEAYRHEIEALDVTITNYRDLGLEKVSSTFQASRIVASDLLEFSGTIHETPVRRGETTVGLETTNLKLLGIDHLGYVDDVVDDRGKRRRNLDLARAQHDGLSSSPEGASTGIESAKAALDLARSLMLAGDATSEAIDLLRDAVSAAEGTRDDWMAYLLGSLAHLLMESGEHEEAFELASKAHQLVPADDLAAAVFGRTAIRVGRGADLVAAAQAAATMNSIEPVFASPENRRTFEISVVMATASTGDPDRAWSEVEGWASAGQVFNEADWEATGYVAVRAFEGMELLDRLVTFASTQQSAVGLLNAVAPAVSPELTALIAIGVAATGSVAPDAILTGSLAAMVAARWDLFDELVPFASVLEADVRERLAVRLDEKGEHSRAEAVLGKAGNQSSVLAAFGGRSD